MRIKSLLVVIDLLVLFICMPVYCQAAGVIVKNPATDPVITYSSDANNIVSHTGAINTSAAALATASAASGTDAHHVSMPKGAVTPSYHDGISASVAEGSCTSVDLRGYNGLHIQVILTGGTWDFDLYGSQTEAGTYAQEEYNSVDISRDGLAATKNFTFPSFSNYIKIVPTLASGSGTCTVNITPVHM